MRALADAGCTAPQIGVAYYSGMTNGTLQGQISIPGQVIFSKIGIEGIPVYNVENACASGSSAFNLAVQSLKAGTADVALAIGAEKMNIPDKAKAFAIFEGGWDVSRAEENYADAGEDGRRHHAAARLGVGQALQQVHGHLRGVLPLAHEDLRHDAAADRGGVRQEPPALGAQPYSQFRKPFTIDEVLAAPPITYPITLPMCAPLSDGAAAAILCTEDGLKRIGADRKRCIKVAASVIRSFTHRRLDEPREARQPAGRAAGLRDRRPRAGGHGRGRSPRRLGDGRDHPVGEPRASCRSAAAARPPSAASSRSAGASRSIRRAASNRRAIRSAPPASASSSNW